MCVCVREREREREKESERERERERELTDLNDPITDDIGAVVCLLVSCYGQDLCLLHLLTTKTQNTETETTLAVKRNGACLPQAFAHALASLLYQRDNGGKIETAGSSYFSMNTGEYQDRQ